MKRSLIVMIVLGFSASVAGASLVPTVKSAKLALGTVVVSSSGRTLYHYVPEAKGQVKCTGACAAQWPPLLVHAGAKPVAGAGVKAAKLGTRKRPDGRLQVTYGGFALYTFAGDAKAGDTNGEALEGKWYALSPSAAVVKQAAAPSSSGSSSSSSGSGDSSGSSSGGYGY